MSTWIMKNEKFSVKYYNNNSVMSVDKKNMILKKWKLIEIQKLAKAMMFSVI